MYKSVLMPTPRLVGAIVLAFALMLPGCATTRISDYDETTDRNVTALQKKVETYLISLEALDGQPACKYEKQKPFYDEAKVDVSSIEVRAAAIPKNQLTTEQVQLLAGSLDNLEKLHKISCLSKEQIEPLRIQFNASFTAILKLELAKLRQGF